MLLPSPLAETHELRESGAVSVLVRRDWLDALPLESLLEGAPVDTWGAAREHELRGRAAVHVLGTPRGEIVAKQLTRGGLLGALGRRTYLDGGRSWREAALAEQLAAAGCPTPAVVAVRRTRVGPGLSCWDLATARVVGAQDLLDAWRAGGSDAALLEQVGVTLRALHDVGLRHRDLQVKNLLVVPDPVPQCPLVVLDLDRCRLGPALRVDERVAGVSRLLRSALKQGLLPPGPLAASLDVCLPLFEAYGTTSGLAAGELARRARRDLSRGLWRHPWWWARGP